MVVYLRLVDGTIRSGQKIVFMATGARYEVSEVGSLHPDMCSRDVLSAGEVGYLICNIKTLKDTRIGDTVTSAEKPAEIALHGYEEVKPVVFSGMYPAVATDYDELRDALEKLQLNDSSFQYHADSSDALGLGFRLGFLGLLHMEIVQERLEREFGLTLVTTMPNVAYVAPRPTETLSPSTRPANAARRRIALIEETLSAIYFAHTISEHGHRVVQTQTGVHVRVDYIGSNRCMAVYQMPWLKSSWIFTIN